MSKKRFFKNSPLYLLTAANIIYAVYNGFNWLTWMAIVLSLVVLVWDILEVLCGNKRN